ncbi:hypothetical protein [uncultured Moraxella sp.]|uniref:hypothetical protein n=1 Tax=uncultured Moraxella sp. TaxID=263769 RepID=UPI0025DFFB94|nr:hypothetical protein [uncultured Moraxella sp.]
MSQNQAMSSKYFRRQSKFWLIGAGVAAVAWLLVWLTSTAPKIIKKDTPEETVEQTALPTRIDQFHDLEKEVKPIDFSTMVRDMRTYPAEFRDKIFFENIANKYTVQLMDVVENQVIVDYLDGQADRKKFAYFRYLDDNKKPHYVLTYGQFATAAEADAAMKATDFGLPNTINLTTKKAGDYLEIIDNYMRADSISDMSSNQPRRINLQATKSEIPVRAATRADEDLVNRSISKSQERLAQEEEQRQREHRMAQARAQLNQDAPAVNEQVTRTVEPQAAAQEAAPTAKPESTQEAPKTLTVAPATKPEPKAEPKPEPKAADTGETY